MSRRNNQGLLDEGFDIMWELSKSLPWLPAAGLWLVFWIVINGIIVGIMAATHIQSPKFQGAMLLVSGMACVWGWATSRFRNGTGGRR